MRTDWLIGRVACFIAGCLLAGGLTALSLLPRRSGGATPATAEAPEDIDGLKVGDALTYGVDQSIYVNDYFLVEWPKDVPKPEANRYGGYCPLPRTGSYRFLGRKGDIAGIQLVATTFPTDHMGTATCPPGIRIMVNVEELEGQFEAHRNAAKEEAKRAEMVRAFSSKEAK